MDGHRTAARITIELELDARERVRLFESLVLLCRLYDAEAHLGMQTPPQDGK